MQNKEGVVSKQYGCYTQAFGIFDVEAGNSVGRHKLSFSRCSEIRISTTAVPGDCNI